MLRYFRVFCEQLGITQARQVTRAVILNYQSYLYHYRKKDGNAMTIGTQKHWLSAVQEPLQPSDAGGTGPLQPGHRS